MVATTETTPIPLISHDIPRDVASDPGISVIAIMHTRRASIATLQQPAHPMRCGRRTSRPQQPEKRARTRGTPSAQCTERRQQRQRHLRRRDECTAAKQKATRDGPAVKKNSAPQRRAASSLRRPPSSRQQQRTRPPRELVQRCKVRRVGHLTTCMGTPHNNKHGHDHASAQADARHNQCGAVARMLHNAAQALKHQALKAQHKNAVRQSREAALRGSLAQRRRAITQPHNDNSGKVEHHSGHGNQQIAQHTHRRRLVVQQRHQAAAPIRHLTHVLVRAVHHAKNDRPLQLHAAARRSGSRPARTKS